MRNKKLIMIVMAAFSVGAFGLTYFFLTQKEEGQSLPTVAENNCPYASDQEAYDKMIESADEKKCACIQAAGLKNTCLDVASDTGLYKKAISDLNADICGNIDDVMTKESCIAIVRSGLDYKKSLQ